MRFRFSSWTSRYERAIHAHHLYSSDIRMQIARFSMLMRYITLLTVGLCLLDTTAGDTAENCEMNPGFNFDFFGLTRGPFDQTTCTASCQPRFNALTSKPFDFCLAQGGHIIISWKAEITEEHGFKECHCRLWMFFTKLQTTSECKVNVETDTPHMKLRENLISVIQLRPAFTTTLHGVTGCGLDTIQQGDGWSQFSILPEK
ncbi:hypothetical protein BCR37DRAFT_103531 [Protomyces lactucae-debilis]|uniref:Uncharacterized protein n=1 Tax=Protomyces lactucae-debilis TaxID=2754530 RepID=A0A1Y2F581_PROLT|nr:uncharacterized protein BCR37DRAFT_103531 [Protomyces lactucae-debilis]ORY79070.1 hypothetical protein BCR37DRAFT_103531 [Protomyces lactucae-debilis]